MNQSDEKQGQSGFEDDNLPEDSRYAICNHPGHQPPQHLYVPPGKKYRHVCPGCGKVTYLRSLEVRY